MNTPRLGTPSVPQRWRELPGLVRDYLKLVEINRRSHDAFARELARLEREVRDRAIELEAEVAACDEAEVLAGLAGEGGAI